MNKNNKKDVKKLNLKVNITKEKYNEYLFMEFPNNINRYPHVTNINKYKQDIFMFGEKNVFISSKEKHKK